jgi:hypothetical protein
MAPSLQSRQSVLMAGNRSSHEIPAAKKQGRRALVEALTAHGCAGASRISGGREPKVASFAATDAGLCNRFQTNK